MNEESITPLGTSGLRALPEKVKRKVGKQIGKLFGRGERDHAHDPPETEAESKVSPELRERADASIREYVEENEPLFNRAFRFEEKAERLQEGDGATSESALRRAERARAEIRTGLAELRERFASSEGKDGTLAFDAALEGSYPQFAGGEEG